MNSRLNNPFPHLAEVTTTAGKIIELEREYLRLLIELRAKKEARRVAFFVTALIFLNLTITLSLFWFSFALRDAGWSSLSIALWGLVIFGGLTLLCVWLGMRSTRVLKERERS